MIYCEGRPLLTHVLPLISALIDDRAECSECGGMFDFWLKDDGSALWCRPHKRIGALVSVSQVERRSIVCLHPSSTGAVAFKCDACGDFACWQDSIPPAFDKSVARAEGYAAGLRAAAAEIRTIAARHSSENASWPYASGFRTGIEVAAAELERMAEAAARRRLTAQEPLTLRALTLAVNEECECGGGGPKDGCAACRVYHRLERMAEAQDTKAGK